MSAILKVQVEIYNKLTSYQPLMDKVEGVFDYPDEEKKMPYVVLGEVISTPYYTKVTNGEEITQTIHVFSDQLGKKETDEIITEIEAALKTDPNITGYDIYENIIDSIEVYNDEGMFIHGILKYRVRVMEV